MSNLIFLSNNYRHLICIPYSIANLYFMARQLDIKQCWFHKNHYDIPKKRIKEIQNKTKIVNTRIICQIIKENTA